MPISNELKNYLQEIFAVWTCLALSLFGFITNTTSIAVFKKQGFRDNASISLTAIAIADALRCTVGFFRTIYAPLKLGGHIALAKSWENVSLFALGVLHLILGSSAYSMTSYVSAERCLCVCMPLKVKTLITRKVTLVALFSICMIVLCSYIYMMFSYEIVWIFDRQINATTLVITSTTKYGGESLLHVYTTSVTWFWGIFTCTAIFICTIIIVDGLRASSKFRSSSHFPKDGINPHSKDSGLSSRDRQLVKILIMMNIVHFVNVIPRIAGTFAQEFVPDLIYLGQLSNFVSVFYAAILVLDLLNASANFFFFLTTSTQFRSTFMKMIKQPFCERKREIVTHKIQ